MRVAECGQQGIASEGRQRKGEEGEAADLCEVPVIHAHVLDGGAEALSKDGHGIVRLHLSTCARVQGRDVNVVRALVVQRPKCRPHMAIT